MNTRWIKSGSEMIRVTGLAALQVVRDDDSHHVHLYLFDGSQLVKTGTTRLFSDGGRYLLDTAEDPASTWVPVAPVIESTERREALEAFADATAFPRIRVADWQTPALRVEFGYGGDEFQVIASVVDPAAINKALELVVANTVPQHQNSPDVTSSAIGGGEA